MTNKSPTLAIGIFLLAAFIHLAPVVASQDAAAAAYAVTGVVKNDKGEPIPGASVSGWTMPPDGGSQSYDSTTSDKEGGFTLHLASGKGQVYANAEGYREGGSADILVDGADLTGVTLTLVTPPPRNALIEGTVRNEQGEPIEGATVSIGQGCCYILGGPGATEPAPPRDAPTEASANSSEGSAGGGVDAKMSRPIWYDGDYQTTTTGADGKFAFKTYAGPRQLTASAKGYAQTSITVEAVDGQTVTADLKLAKVPPADATLIVKVIDARTGLPLAGASVSLQNAEWSRYAWASAGEDGTATLTTIPGWVILNVNHYDQGIVVAEGGDAVASIAPAPQRTYYAYAHAFRLDSGKLELTVKLESKPDPEVVVTGYVVDPDAETGVPNAWVNVWNMDTGDWGNAQTDATGSFKLLLRPGHYTMNVWAEGHYPGATTFVIGDEKTKRVDVWSPKGETKYAPCEDQSCGGYPVPLYSKGAEDAASGSPQTSLATRETAAGPPAGADATRAAAYSGTGGGLPPYEAASAPDGQAVTAAKGVPFVGVLALVGAVVAVALLLRGRR